MMRALRWQSPAIPSLIGGGLVVAGVLLTMTSVLESPWSFTVLLVGCNVLGYGAGRVAIDQIGTVRNYGRIAVTLALMGIVVISLPGGFDLSPSMTTVAMGVGMAMVGAGYGVYWSHEWGKADAAESTPDTIYPSRQSVFQLAYRPARILSQMGYLIAILGFVSYEGRWSFTLWAGAIILGLLLGATARIWNATEHENGIEIARSIAILGLHGGIALVAIAVLGATELATAVRIGAGGIGISFAMIGYVYNRRQRQARGELRTDERLRTLKHRAAFRVTQVTYGLIVAGILLVLIVEPTMSLPIVPVFVGIMLVGILSYAAFYGYYETQL